MTFYEEISANKTKSVVLIIIFFILVMALGYFFGFFFATPIFGLIIAFVIMVIMVLVGYYSGDSIILSMHKAKEIKKEDDPYLWNTVEGLSIAAQIPMPKVYIIEEESPNAFATGRDPKHSSITVTS